MATERLELLETYDWPGNVRQPENSLEQAVGLCEGERLPRAASRLRFDLSRAL